MTEININNKIENILNNIEALSFFTVDGSAKDQFKYRTANRLLKAWRKLLSNQINKEDFEILLKEYLLLFKCTLQLSNYEESDLFSKIGLIKNDDGSIWSSYNIPSYVNGKFIKKIYEPTYLTEVNNNKYDLRTNAFIESLTDFKYFKSEEQKLVVMGALRTPPGYTALISMSTGGGKSLITQTIAYQESGLTLVIVPTVSLMMDQVRSAKAILKRKVDEEIFCYYSGQNLTPFLNALSNKTARILFVSPEAIIKNKQLFVAIEKANAQNYLKNLVVDEAHIVSEWGASFRVDFQCFDIIRKTFIDNNSELRTFLLSATFSERTVSQLKQAYADGDNWIELRCDKLRSEICYDVIKTDNRVDKIKKLKEIIPLLPLPLIVYVSRPDDASFLQKQLAGIGVSNTRTFTGRTNSIDRERIINEWINDEFPIMIATCAFGVGVDKKDVRTVLHTYIPENANKYYQEAGRGGRDGLLSLSAMIYEPEDADYAFKLTTKVLTINKLAGRWFSMLGSDLSSIKSGGIVMLDTSVKPSYAEYDYFDWANNADVNWNVYVILLLRRGGLVEIEGMEYLDQRYLFTLKLSDISLLRDNSQSRQLLEKIRDDEWDKNLKEFQMMQKALNYVGKRCWSDMFNCVYTLTDAYCAGCNQHNNIEQDGVNVFPLKKSTKIVRNHHSVAFYKYLGESNACICFEENNIEKCVGLLIRLGVTTFVGFENCVNFTNYSPLLTNWNNYEFFELARNGQLYLSGPIAINYKMSEFELLKVLTIIDNFNMTTNYQLILVCKDDIFIAGRNKKISEIVNGPCLHSYILEEDRV